MATQRSFFKSLRGKISIQMLLVSLLPILIIGAVVYTSMLRAENKASDSVDDSRAVLANDTIGKTKARMAWVLSLELETWAAERVAEVKSWSGNSDIRQMLAKGADKERKAWGFLAEKVGNSPFLSNAYVTDLLGNRLVQATGFNSSNESENPVWQKAKNSGLAVGTIQLDASKIQPTFDFEIAYRIDDFSTGEAMGIVTAQISLNPITLSQEYGSKFPDDRLVIWDYTGRLLVDSGDLERYLQEKPTWSESEQKVRAKMPKNTTIVEPAYVITDKAVAGYARAANTSVSMQFPGFDGLGWMVMIEEPTQTAFVALNSLEDLKDDLSNNTNTTVIILVVLILVVAAVVPGVAFYLSRGITRPLAQLRDTAEKVSLGDMDVTVRVESDDEIGDLAQSFERMVTAIRFLSADDSDEKKE